MLWLSLNGDWKGVAHSQLFIKNTYTHLSFSSYEVDIAFYIMQNDEG